FCRDRLEDTLPEAVGVGHYVGFIRHQDLVTPVLPRVFKGVSDHALDPMTRVYVFLDGDLVRRALFKYSAHEGVGAFGVLADDYEVDVLGADVFERTERIIEAPYWSDIRIQVELEAHAKQDVPGMNIGWDARIANGAKENCVEVARQYGERVRWERGAVFE